MERSALIVRHARRCAIEIVAPGGRAYLAWISAASRPATCSGSRIAANDCAIPAEPELCRLAGAMIDDCGTEAPRIASERAMRAFWAGDMATCKRWTRTARMIDAHFAACVERPRRGDLRDVMATLAV